MRGRRSKHSLRNWRIIRWRWTTGNGLCRRSGSGIARWNASTPRTTSPGRRKARLSGRSTRSDRNYQVEVDYRERVVQEVREWDREVERFYASDDEPRPAQSAVIGAVNTFSDPSDVVVCASGSMPGDLHKLWQTRDPRGYHLEYGYSCMGYEIAGGLGIKLADPEREVYVMVGDGSYLMLNGEIVTSIQERQKLTIVLVDNHGFASIGELSDVVGSGGFGTHYQYRENGSLGTNTETP